MTNNEAISAKDLISAGRMERPPTEFGQEGKEELAQSGRPFTVTDLQFGTGDNGPYWQFTVRFDDGEVGMFRLSSHQGRDAFIAAIQNAVGEVPVSGLRLRSRNPNAANQFLVLDVVD